MINITHYSRDRKALTNYFKGLFKLTNAFIWINWNRFDAIYKKHRFKYMDINCNRQTVLKCNNSWTVKPYTFFHYLLNLRAFLQHAFAKYVHFPIFRMWTLYWLKGFQRAYNSTTNLHKNALSVSRTVLKMVWILLELSFSIL